MVSCGSSPGRRRRAGGHVMASGRQLMPGAAVTTERTVTAEQQMTTGRGTGTATWPGQDAGNAAGQEIEQPERPARRGGGGRWLVWVMRAIVWVVLLLIGYRGIVAIVSSYRGGSQSQASVSPNPDGFPVALAQAFALEFGQVYLNFSPATAAQRASELAPFLAAGTNPQLGWNGNGSQAVQAEQVAGVDVQDAHSAVVKLLALANGRMIEIGIPIYYSAGGIVVSGQPAFLPPPPGLVLPAPAKSATDALAGKQLTAQLPAFFRAFAGSDTAQIDKFAAPGVHLSGLNNEVGFGSILEVTVPVTAGSVKHITVTVAWLPASTPSAGPTSSAGGRAQIDMTYAMSVLAKGSHWYVVSIGASTALPRPSS
jgi:hypothetical protein